MHKTFFYYNINKSPMYPEHYQRIANQMILYMSGHSKWHNIMKKKEKSDKAKSGVSTKLCRGITIAAQQGGGDPSANFTLRLLIDKARAANIPKDNIERAIKRGSGELSGEAALEVIVYEGFGPQGVTFLVEALTDNRNRAASEIKYAITKHGGTVGGPGSVQWQFAHKGVLRFSLSEKTKISDWDLFELDLIDAGVDNIEVHDTGVEITCPIERFQVLIELTQSKGIVLEDSGLEWVAKETVSVNDESRATIDAIYQALDELDDVREVYWNL